MRVAKLNINPEQLAGREFVPGNQFEPIQDAVGNWIVSRRESFYLQPDEYELIEYQPANLITPN